MDLLFVLFLAVFVILVSILFRGFFWFLRNILTLLVYCALALTIAAEVAHNYYWREYTGSIPHDALRFNNLYVAQVPYNGLLPGALYPEKREAVTECFGKKLTWTKGVKLLCDVSSSHFYWEFVNVNQLTEDKLKDCVVGGLESNSTLYIGKVFHQGEWKIGKIFPPSSQYKGFKAWWANGDQYGTDDCEILKYRTEVPNHNIREVTTVTSSNGVTCSALAPTNIDTSGLSEVAKSPMVLLYFCVFAATITDKKPTYYWKDYDGGIPGDALRFNNQYVAQVPCKENVIPGTLRPDSQEVISLCAGEKTVVRHDVKVLCSSAATNFFWEYVNVNKLTEHSLGNLVVGGAEENVTLYIGKIYHEGEWKIGKVYPPTSEWKGLRVWYNNGDKYVVDDFQILKY